MDSYSIIHKVMFVPPTQSYIHIDVCSPTLSHTISPKRIMGANITPKDEMHSARAKKRGVSVNLISSVAINT